MNGTEENVSIIRRNDLPLIPEEAFLYFPSQQEIKTGEGEKGQRRIFEGQVEFDAYEKTKIAELNAYIEKKKYQTIPWWNDARKLRFLQATGFKMDKTLKTIESQQEWRLLNLPPKMTPEINDFMQRGAFYVHGRDNRFRPILIINVRRFDFKHIKIDLILQSMTVFFEFILSSMMLPGQIENWVVILDLGDIGLASLPISGLKQIMTYLSSNYRSRMFATYVVNTPSSIFIPYRIIKGFLEESTIKKISFFSNSEPKALFKHCNPSQIEQTYRGTAKNLQNNFWPPQIISNEYQMKEENPAEIFHSKEEYNQKFKAGKLLKNVTLREYVDIDNDSNYVNPDSFAFTAPPKKQASLGMNFVSCDALSDGVGSKTQPDSSNLMPAKLFKSFADDQYDNKQNSKPYHPQYLLNSACNFENKTGGQQMDEIDEIQPELTGRSSRRNQSEVESQVMSVAEEYSHKFGEPQAINNILAIKLHMDHLRFRI